MEMKVIHSKKRLCTCCMEEHEVKTVCMLEHSSFKGVMVEHKATYFYCDIAEEFYMDENQMRENDFAMKDAYRIVQGLLTSREIVDIRERYGISQKDLCILLGWGEKTITRYESHQIQDRAHDTILRKLGEDPAWFLELLENAKESLLSKLYCKYYDTATFLYEKDQDSYLRKSIEARYVRFQKNEMLRGNAALSLDKVVDMIRYFAASVKVTNLYKVKLMKLMWYSDALSFKRRGRAITGLVYQALPMGAVPVGYDSIIDLKGVPCEEVDMGETMAYHFVLEKNADCPSLDAEEKKILDMVINKLGRMTKDEIISFMHKEEAYEKTAPRDIISFQYAKALQI